MYPGSVLDLDPSIVSSSPPLIIRTNRTWGLRSDRKRYRVPTPPGTPKPADITGGGLKDWDTDRDTLIEPLGDVIVDGWIADKGIPGADRSDLLLTVIGHDTNGNGKLDANEITAIIGECREVPGKNYQYIEQINGVFYIHHINWKDVNGNGIPDDGDNFWHYIYNTSTGVLKIYDRNGNLVYMGTPDGQNNQIPPHTPWNWLYDN